MTISTVIVPDQTELPSLSDAELLAVQADIAALCRHWAAEAARVAGEVQRRCAPELGQGGLAQRSGLRTPEALIQQVTGVTRVEARGLLRVGEMLAADPPWLAGVTSAVATGSLSVAAAQAIGDGLGVPTPEVAADDLADAARRLVEASTSGVSPEKIAAAARACRDDLDSVGVTEREHQLRGKRFLRLIPQSDGMTRIVGLLDPESAAVVAGAVDAVTAPRRGGPRFDDPEQVAAAERVVEDSRTTEQIALDAVVDMIRISTRADAGSVFAHKQPSVRVHVTLNDLDRRAAAAEHPQTLDASNDLGDRRDSHGYGRLEGSDAAVSLATVERLACASGYIPILFDGGQPLNVGRTQRLFTAVQRIALAARDGGCIFPNCDRPPSWCEAHHTKHWHRDRGGTDIADGVLLCHHHHLLTHNHGWEITRSGSEYWFVPPATIDSAREARPAQKRQRLAG